MTIKDVFKEYRRKIKSSELEIILANAIGKKSPSVGNREFVLSHPEYKLTGKQLSEIKKDIRRRINSEPIAYITGHKEFYNLNFKVNKNTLIPRPETEMLVEKALSEIKKNKPKETIAVIDVGTGSGNIIISLAKNANQKKCHFFGVDISEKALFVAKKNAIFHNVNRQITFIQNDLLHSFKTIQVKHLIIVANLPYLSDDIYNSCEKDVKNFEPKTALHSDNFGLAHYKKLFKQINKSLLNNKKQIITTTIIIEISPEQKTLLEKDMTKYFPKANIAFEKDLSDRWRMCLIKIKNKE